MLADKLSASKPHNSIGIDLRRRGSAKQSSVASADPAPAPQPPSLLIPCPVPLRTDVLITGAVVKIDIVVVPPPVNETGLNEQVVSVPAGGVQPKLTVPLNPPTRPSNITTWPFCPAFSVKVCGTIVTV
jgi:hypothetical protein